MVTRSAMVKVECLADGEPFAIVIDSDVRAETTAAVDGTSVTIVLRKPGLMPCSLIFPGDVAEQVFGPDFICVRPKAESDGDTDPGEPHTFTGGGA
jgi:hypothetical protein